MRWSLIRSENGRHMFFRIFPSTRTNGDLLRQNVGSKYGEPLPNFRMKTISTRHCHWKLQYFVLNLCLGSKICGLLHLVDM